MVICLNPSSDAGEIMWKALWRKWTIDKPAVLGDWLWDVFVVRLAAFLNQLTLRQIIASIPVIVLIIAYSYKIPLPPTLMLVGDLLAYIDIFSVVLLISILSRATTVLFIIKQTATRIGTVASRLLSGMRRLDFRHRRQHVSKTWKELKGRSHSDDGEVSTLGDVAYA